MIKLYKFSDTYFIILQNGKPAFSGNVIEVQTRLEGLGVAEDEVDLAIKWLLTTNDNMAHFGIKKKALFTTYEEIHCPAA